MTTEQYLKEILESYEFEGNYTGYMKIQVSKWHFLTLV